MKRRNTAHENRGFSLLELVIVVAITVVVLAVATPILLATYRAADLKTAQAEMASAIRRASEASATGGAHVSFSATAVPVPARVAVNPTALRYFPGAIIADDVTFQGGTGYPWVARANQTAVVVLADEADGTRAVAVVVGPSGTVTRMRMTGPYTWEEER
jgi:prepilin-type N-terminal cleavage/methylation domain-containing protein